MIARRLAGMGMVAALAACGVADGEQPAPAIDDQYSNEGEQPLPAVDDSAHSISTANSPAASPCEIEADGESDILGIPLGAFAAEVGNWFDCRGGYRVTQSRTSYEHYEKLTVRGTRNTPDFRESIVIELVGLEFPRVWRVGRIVDYENRIIAFDAAVESVEEKYQVSYASTDTYVIRYRSPPDARIGSSDYPVETSVSFGARDQENGLVSEMNVSVRSEQLREKFIADALTEAEQRRQNVIEAGQAPEL